MQPAREFAESLLVSPASVQRAYRELVKEGFLNLESNGGAPLISGKSQSLANPERADLFQQFAESVQTLRKAGVEWEEIESIFEDLKDDLRRDSGKSVKSACPYCRERMKPDDSCVRCMLCRTTHHEDCWEEAGHCSVYGCAGRVIYAIYKGDPTLHRSRNHGAGRHALQVVGWYLTDISHQHVRKALADGTGSGFSTYNGGNCPSTNTGTVFPVLGVYAAQPVGSADNPIFVGAQCSGRSGRIAGVDPIGNNVYVPTAQYPADSSSNATGPTPSRS